MMVVDVRGDVQTITRHLSRLAMDQIPFATALALTRTAKFAEQKVKEEIGRAFDRPTPYALGATYVTPATKQRLWAQVKIKDRENQFGTSRAQINSLAPEIYGGGRQLKAFEVALRARGILPSHLYAVPGMAAQMDGYGNMAKAQIVQIIAFFDAFGRFAGDAANMGEKGRKRLAKGTRKRRGKTYFAISKSGQRFRPGIYEIIDTGFGPTHPRPVMVFVSRPRYRRRLRFFDIADQTARMRFPIEFGLAARHAIQTARVF